MEKVKLIGIYRMFFRRNVSLIELEFDVPPAEVEADKITQRDEELPCDRWQAAYDEHYLSEDGTAVIGEWRDNKNLSGEKTRLAFYMYYVRFDKPLTTQFGDISLRKPERIPSRLRKILKFEPAD